MNTITLDSVRISTDTYTRRGRPVHRAGVTVRMNGVEAIGIKTRSCPAKALGVAFAQAVETARLLKKLDDAQREASRAREDAAYWRHEAAKRGHAPGMNRAESAEAKAA